MKGTHIKILLREDETGISVLIRHHWNSINSLELIINALQLMSFLGNSTDEKEPMRSFNEIIKLAEVCINSAKGR